MDYARALKHLLPNCEFKIENNCYEGITLIGTEDPVPTESELENAWNEVQILDGLNRYKDMRRAEYPPIAEQLDMIYHDIDAWKSTINSIKEKYPKPE